MFKQKMICRFAKLKYKNFMELVPFRELINCAFADPYRVNVYLLVSNILFHTLAI